MQDAQEKGYSQSAALLAHEDAAKGGSIFKLHSDYEPTGDQPQAIEALVKGSQEGNQCQTLLLRVPVRHLLWRMSSRS